MKYPFSTNSTEFQKQYKEALGFTDADIPLRKIKPDLRNAAQELIDLIGKSTYDSLIANTELNIEGAEDASTPYQDEDMTEIFRYALATMSYAMFAPSNDLAHTPNGRRMRSSGDEKTPFEHMIVRSDDVLQRRSFKAADRLLNYLDQNSDTWKDSDAFKASHKLFVRNLKDYEPRYQLSSSLLFLKLRPGLEMCENRNILSRIGSTVFESLKAKVLYFAKEPDGEAQEAITLNEARMITLIKDACCYYALSWGIKRLQINLFPEGVLQPVRGDRATIRGRSVPQFLEVDQVSNLFLEDCNKSLKEIEDHYKVMFPPPVVETSETESEDPYGFNKNDNFVST
ncbi:DUF6712 family protein [Lacinutrix iliipiscaria]|uniref:DUF6712 family protein n=1 Tax=Lacinutrix iliipiscaria TaxID=1230532 RepID=A0ABW5WPX1_9FLAO